MVDPKLMCRAHLLGEHRELHTLVGALRKGRSIQGYVDDGLVEVHNVVARHDELVAEFRRRGWPSGYVHTTPIESFDGFTAGSVNVGANALELMRRCAQCAARTRQELFHVC
jgi:hypothetical protein